MISKILVTVCILLYAALIPILEINGSHVFNPEWTPHARLHEVWQLATNTSLGIFSLFLVWQKNIVRLPSILAIFITGGFLFAYAIRNIYDGSMVLSDGSEKIIIGLNGGVVVFSLVIILSMVAIALENRQRQTI